MFQTKHCLPPPPSAITNREFHQPVLLSPNGKSDGQDSNHHRYQMPNPADIERHRQPITCYATQPHPPASANSHAEDRANSDIAMNPVAIEISQPEFQ